MIEFPLWGWSVPLNVWLNLFSYIKTVDWNNRRTFSARFEMTTNNDRGSADKLFTTQCYCSHWMIAGYEHTPSSDTICRSARMKWFIWAPVTDELPLAVISKENKQTRTLPYLPPDRSHINEWVQPLIVLVVTDHILFWQSDWSLWVHIAADKTYREMLKKCNSVGRNWECAQDEWGW